MHTIVLFAFENCELLDVAGPASVFGAANSALRKPVYDVQIASPAGGPIATSSGVVLHSRSLASISPKRVDTLLIAGGGNTSMRRVLDNAPSRRWISRTVQCARRFGTVCAGTFILGDLGMLDGRRVATHWASCDQLARRYPQIAVDRDAMFVVDGPLWTSAGVSTGIDMALAMVEQDHGRTIANAVAKFLVIYVRRPGHQSQFSSLLRVQASVGTPFAELANWIQSRLSAKLDVPTLAAHAGLSLRTFHRKFVAATGQTPASFVEDARLEAARALLDTGLPLKTIAQRTGLYSAARMSAAFERQFGLAPSLFRKMHSITMTSRPRQDREVRIGRSR
jgi:transcriptional regulator GlxA family with amidase domain